MSNWLDIISASGSVATAASVVSAFVLYKKEVDNAHITQVRKALQVLYNNINELDGILNAELAYEMASSVVYSSGAQFPMKGIYRICNDAIKNGGDKEKVQNEIKDTLGVFLVPFHSDLSIKYNNLLTEVTTQAIVFNPNYKGLYRFSMAVTLWMRNIYGTYKRSLLDEELLSKFIYGEMVKHQTEWKSYDAFQKALLDKLLSLLESMRRKDWQKNVNSLKTLIDMIYSSHIGLTNAGWNTLKRANRKVQAKPYTSTETITEDLREAEKYFRTILSHDECLKYTSLVQSMEEG